MANPSFLDQFRRGEPFRGVTGKPPAGGFDYFRRGEPVSALISGVHITITATVAAAAAAAAAAPTTLSPGGASSYPTEVLADGPRGYWRMDAPSGNFTDTSGFGNRLDTFTGVTYGVTGALPADSNKAATLNGDGSLFHKLTADHDLGDVLTLEAWVKTTNYTQTKVLFSKGTNAYLLSLVTSSSHLYLTLAKQTDLDICTSTVQFPEDGAWHHLVATKNGSTVHLYQDGVDVSGAVTNQTLTNNSTILHVGGKSNDTQRMVGSLDEVAIYPTALSAARVLVHYTGSSSSGAGTDYAAAYADAPDPAVKVSLSPTSGTVRTFNGSSDYIKLTAGANDVGYGTYLAVAMFAGSVGASEVPWLTSISGTTEKVSAWVRFGHLGYYNTHLGVTQETTTSISGWQIFAETKATGATTPRAHVCTLTSRAWVHADMAGSGNDGDAANGWYIGAHVSFGDFFNGPIYLVAYWNTVLSDVQLETITSVATLRALSPTGLWILDQADVGTAVVEVNGSGADQTAISGTTVTTGVQIPNFGVPELAGAYAAAATPTLSATVSAPIATAAAAAFTPTFPVYLTGSAAGAVTVTSTVSGNVTIAGVLAVAAASAATPGLVTSLGGAVTGAVTVTVRLSTSIAVPAVAASASALTPQIVVGQSSSPLIAHAAASALVPTLVETSAPVAVPALVTAQALAATTTVSGSTLVVATGSAAAGVGTPAILIVVATGYGTGAYGAGPFGYGTPLIAAVAAAPAPSVIVEAAAVNVTVVVAEAVAAGLAAVPSGGATTTPAEAFAIAWGGATGQPTVSVELLPDDSSATAGAFVADFTIDSSIASPVAAAVADAVAPHVRIGLLTPIDPTDTLLLTPILPDDDLLLTPVAPAGDPLLTPV